jgi:hypothetical protein
MPKYIFETDEPIKRCVECPIWDDIYHVCNKTDEHHGARIGYTATERPASCPLREVPEGENK